MIYIALSSAVLIFACLILLLSPLTKKKERINSRIERISNMYDKKDKFNDEILKKPMGQRFVKPLLKRFLEGISNIFPKLDTKKSKMVLEKAGYKIPPVTYNVILFLVIIASGMGFMLLAFILDSDVLVVVLFTILGMVFGMLIMKYILRINTRRRKEALGRQMPEVLDLLSVSVEAGLGFDAALLHVISRIKGPLTDELLVAHREISMGRSRRDALAALGERSGLESMMSFTNAVIQAERKGLSLKNVLNIQAKQIRQQRRQAIEEKAMKAPVKIIVPLVVFIFPVILIVLLAPAIINILGILGGM
ncbi:MAG: hypothetical protein HN389_07730 [Clostridia bacterium]|jgi:tight adherence protein C|nr:hypothetical protein [Clostridia bacterium]